MLGEATKGAWTDILSRTDKLLPSARTELVEHIYQDGRMTNTAMILFQMLKDLQHNRAHNQKLKDQWMTVLASTGELIGPKLKELLDYIYENDAATEVAMIVFRLLQQRQTRDDEGPPEELVEKIKRDNLHKLLTSYFYELARDHAPIGVLNKMLRSSYINCKYSDPGLQAWAEEHAAKLMYRATMSTGAERTPKEKPDVNINEW